ncbi:hypothetical protein AX16_003452 [Volvariella volvacea WC 439]|nr:hypothetical protein AX16_003452 [Volvariella volvacea WC 439]
MKSYKHSRAMQEETTTIFVPLNDTEDYDNSENDAVATHSRLMTPMRRTPSVTRTYTRASRNRHRRSLSRANSVSRAGSVSVAGSRAGSVERFRSRSRSSSPLPPPSRLRSPTPPRRRPRARSRSPSRSNSPPRRTARGRSRSQARTNARARSTVQERNPRGQENKERSRSRGRSRGRTASQSFASALVSALEKGWTQQDDSDEERVVAEKRQRQKPPVRSDGRENDGLLNAQVVDTVGVGDDIGISAQQSVVTAPRKRRRRKSVFGTRKRRKQSVAPANRDGAMQAESAGVSVSLEVVDTQVAEEARLLSQQDWEKLKYSFVGVVIKKRSTKSHKKAESSTQHQNAQTLLDDDEILSVPRSIIEDELFHNPWREYEVSEEDAVTREPSVSPVIRSAKKPPSNVRGADASHVPDYMVIDEDHTPTLSIPPPLPTSPVATTRVASPSPSSMPPSSISMNSEPSQPTSRNEQITDIDVIDLTADETFEDTIVGSQPAPLAPLAKPLDTRRTLPARPARAWRLTEPQMEAYLDRNVAPMKIIKSSAAPKPQLGATASETVSAASAPAAATSASAAEPPPNQPRPDQTEAAERQPSAFRAPVRPAPSRELFILSSNLHFIEQMHREAKTKALASLSISAPATTEGSSGAESVGASQQTRGSAPTVQRSEWYLTTLNDIFGSGAIQRGDGAKPRLANSNGRHNEIAPIVGLKPGTQVTVSARGLIFVDGRGQESENVDGDEDEVDDDFVPNVLEDDGGSPRAESVLDSEEEEEVGQDELNALTEEAEEAERVTRRRKPVAGSPKPSDSPAAVPASPQRVVENTMNLSPEVPFNMPVVQDTPPSPLANNTRATSGGMLPTVKGKVGRPRKSIPLPQPRPRPQQPQAAAQPQPAQQSPPQQPQASSSRPSAQHVQPTHNMQYTQHQQYATYMRMQPTASTSQPQGQPYYNHDQPPSSLSYYRPTPASVSTSPSAPPVHAPPPPPSQPVSVPAPAPAPQPPVQPRLGLFQQPWTPPFANDSTRTELSFLSSLQRQYQQSRPQAPVVVQPTPVSVASPTPPAPVPAPASVPAPVPAPAPALAQPKPSRPPTNRYARSRRDEVDHVPSSVSPPPHTETRGSTPSGPVSRISTASTSRRLAKARRSVSGRLIPEVVITRTKSIKTTNVHVDVDEDEKEGENWNRVKAKAKVKQGKRVLGGDRSSGSRKS